MASTPGRVRAIAATITIALAAGGLTNARAQVSPGPLAKAHAGLDGNLGCVKCHGKGAGEMDRKCLACHEEIGSLVSKRKGFHGREGTRDCARCHPDHGGREFAMIAWPDKSPAKFDHARAGWPLAGKHAAVECRKCHTSAHVSKEMQSLVKNKSREIAWVGLDTDCRGCHEDVHRGSLGSDCTRCHDEQGWKPAHGFDHVATAFALTGKHATVACAACHEAARLQLAKDERGRVVPLYKPLPHDECSACHADPHQGSFGAQCSRCHVTAGFKQTSAEGFDHDRTRYPLRGAHATLKCAACHDEKAAWGKKPLFATCAGCHKDAHAGQTAVAGKATDCAACHTVSAFAPSTFTVVQHAETKYPLDGAHARVACRDCHRRKPAGTPAQVAAALGSAGVWLHPAHGRCVECHRDPHEGRFAPGGERAREDDCRACHSMDAFRPSLVDAAMHAGTRFPLEGAHRAVPCFACHQDMSEPARASAPSTRAAGAAPSAKLLMRIDDRSCRGCHESPHGTQFDGRKDKGACESCHGVEAFVPASHFDHARVKNFQLDGAHARVACVKCHPIVTAGRKRMALYRPISARCESCHADGDVLENRN